MAASFPGTQPAFVQLVDGVPPAGDAYQASQVNSIYDEIEAMGTHFGAGTPITAGGGTRPTLKDGVTTVGYCGQKAEAAVAGVAQTVIPAGAYDVTAIVMVAWVVEASDGQVSWGTDGLEPSDSADIFEDDAGNILTLSVAAGGAVTVVRTGGALTYNVVLNFLAWI